MWWHIVIAVFVGLIIGAGVFSWGWNVGYKYGREEDSYQRYVDAMKGDEE